MTMTVQKWGNSLGIRIPKPLAQGARLEEGTAVEIRPTKDGLLIKALRRRKHSLRDLVSRITPRSRHGEIDLGPDVGRERT
jgi:antitoxin MazE